MALLNEKELLYGFLNGKEQLGHKKVKQVWKNMRKNV